MMATHQPVKLCFASYARARVHKFAVLAVLIRNPLTRGQGGKPVPAILTGQMDQIVVIVHVLFVILGGVLLRQILLPVSPCFFSCAVSLSLVFSLKVTFGNSLASVVTTVPVTVTILSWPSGPSVHSTIWPVPALPPTHWLTAHRSCDTLSSTFSPQLRPYIAAE